jgi:N-acetylneuraminate 9-O-acetyltransferase
MTGFGNYLYFDKTQDFTVTRAVSMWLRINYFPLLLSWALSVPLELYYVVPLHTAGFFVTMATCYLSKQLATSRATAHLFSQDNKRSANVAALGICLLVHILFYETPAVNMLKVFSDEYLFRFQSDKYSAWVGMVSGFCWGWLKEYMQWCYNTAAGENSDPESAAVTEDSIKKSKQVRAQWIQRIGGVGLIATWWLLFGHLTDKYTYNPIHPYCFWMPVAGWLMVRNSSKYLMELHSTALEFFGRITLETYVLQFHVFMCRDVQYIPILVPGSGPDGNIVCKTINMLIWGVAFVALSFWARQITVTTQTTLTDLVQLLINGPPSSSSSSQLESEKAVDVEKVPLFANHSEPNDVAKEKSILRTSSDDTIDTVSTALSDEV